MTQRLRREAISAQQVGRQSFAFLCQADQEVLRADIRVTQFVGRHESTTQCILDARRHANFALERLVTALGFGFDLSQELVEGVSY